jgi:hypothetical protein
MLKVELRDDGGSAGVPLAEREVRGITHKKNFENLEKMYAVLCHLEGSPARPL